jgi:polysaccharide export outer membrane protein
MVQVTRKRAQGLGGGRIRTNLDFLSLITENNESQNIRLFDGDVVNVSKSNVVMRDQLLKAGQTNLSPEFMNVFISGRVKNPGGVEVPQGATLNQALALVGGPKLLRGKVEFIRFTREGDVDRRIFSYNPGAASGSPNNPVLMAGDLITVRESPLSATATLLNEITTPVLGIYSIYSIFNN